MKNHQDLFVSLTLGGVFVTLGACRILLIRFSANDDGKYDYLPVTVNVCAEFMKLLVCSILAIQHLCAEGKSWKEIFCSCNSDIFNTLKWAIPGLLYFCDNLLAFYVIKYLQPALVVLLGNFVIITTSLLYRLVLKRQLSRVQWASLAILFLAIVSLSNQSEGSVTIEHHKHHAVNHLITTNNQSEASPYLYPLENVDLCRAEDTQFQVNNKSTGNDLLKTFKQYVTSKKGFGHFNFHEGHVLIIIQCIISSSANVYNEKIFKEGSGLQDSIYVQNTKLYFFGVIFNSLTILEHSVYKQKVFKCGFFHGHNAYSLILIFVTALYGLVVAFILKFRSNMFHVLSAQLMTVIVITVSIYMFSFKPRLEFFLTAPIVLLAIYVYNSSKKKEKAFLDIAGRPIRLNNQSNGGEEMGLIISPDDMRE